MKLILTSIILLFAAKGFSFGLINDVKKLENGYGVFWASCSAFPTLSYTTEALNEKDIIVKFKADQSSSCVLPETLSEISMKYFSKDELFNRVRLKPTQDSEVFVAW